MMLITTLLVSFLVCCMLEVRCGLVSGLQAKARALACSYCAVIRRRNIKFVKANINSSTVHFSMLNCNRGLEYIL